MCSSDWGIEPRILRSSSQVFNHCTTQASTSIDVVNFLVTGMRIRQFFRFNDVISQTVEPLDSYTIGILMSGLGDRKHMYLAGLHEVVDIVNPSS